MNNINEKGTDRIKLNVTILYLPKITSITILIQKRVQNLLYEYVFTIIILPKLLKR